MEKEYKQSEEEVNSAPLKEPALQYERKKRLLPPCQYTPEEVREGVRRSIKQFEEGKFYTDDEIDDLILS